MEFITFCIYLLSSNGVQKSCTNSSYECWCYICQASQQSCPHDVSDFTWYQSYTFHVTARKLHNRYTSQQFTVKTDASLGLPHPHLPFVVFSCVCTNMFLIAVVLTCFILHWMLIGRYWIGVTPTTAVTTHFGINIFEPVLGVFPLGPWMQVMPIDQSFFCETFNPQTKKYGLL